MFKDQIKVKNEMEKYLKNSFFLLFYLPCLFVFYLNAIEKKKKIKMRIKLDCVC